MRNSKTRVMSITAMFAAIASLLMFFEMPLPFMPPFLKLDISSVPVLILGFMFGPMPAVMAAAVKDIVHVFSTQTGGVGELADFLITSSFAVTASLVYMKNKNTILVEPEKNELNFFHTFIKNLHISVCGNWEEDICIEYVDLK